MCRVRSRLLDTKYYSGEKSEMRNITDVRQIQLLQLERSKSDIDIENGSKCRGFFQHVETN